MKKTFRLATLGCRTNQYETEAYRKQLLDLGLVEAQGEETAFICIVNTCTVTSGADKSSRHEIREFARRNPGSQVVVTGCLAERDPDLISSIEGVTHVVSNSQKEKLIETIFPNLETYPEFAIDHFSGHTRAFVKVQDGCNSFCTYCIIPYVRGRSRSRPIPDVVKEVQALIETGYKEVVITGINVGDFDAGGTLAELMTHVDHVAGLKRLRLSSIDPDEVNSDLEGIILNGRTTCPSMHIVLQSGSNVTLKRMNRKYTRQIFLETIDRLKAKRPDFTFTTDIIVGFPGESDADFEETLSVIEEVKFAKVHIFPYSVRDRTRAALYPNKLPPHIIESRKKKASQVAERAAFALREEFVGHKMSILTENHEGRTFGHTANFLPVFVDGHFQPNSLVNVELIENTPQGLIGRAL